MVKLSIIIPHYKEDMTVCDKLFTSIDKQRLIDFGDIEVLVVNDCGEPLKASQFRKYKHVRPRLTKTPENGGVGVARQFGIDNCNGKFLMFIDADDALYSQHSLFYILAAIHNKPETEMFWGNFIEEQIVEEQWGLHLHDKDLTFCHAKVYNKEFLTRKNIKCHPTLRYNEDSYFNALIYSELEKVEYITQPLVIWCYNQQSTVRCGGLYAFKELPCYIKSMTDLTIELVHRKKKGAKVQFLQSLFYVYFQLQDEAWELNRIKGFRPDAIKAIAKFYKQNKEMYESVGETELLNFYNDCRKNAKIPIMESQTFKDFIKELEGTEC